MMLFPEKQKMPPQQISVNNQKKHTSGCSHLQCVTRRVWFSCQKAVLLIPAPLSDFHGILSNYLYRSTPWLMPEETFT